ncbi:MAG: 6-phosphogluconolactonase [Micrococcales bacterium]|nr:6-phosphogluconolactonase [Micrococcales bacterium]
MSTDRIVHIIEDRDALIENIADEFVAVIGQALADRKVLHLCLTGGTVGIGVLAAIGAERRRTALDWNRIHLWWGDERWLPSGDPERNDAQAQDALLKHLAIPVENIHRFPASDGEHDLDAAAEAYARELSANAPESSAGPEFDLVFLGVGPDGHIASLFPGREGIREKDATVIAVRNSPKPPPERLSLTLPVINSAERVWLCLAGADKAAALGLALAGASEIDVPAAGARGRGKTVFFVDGAAASEVPQDLLNDHRAV